MNIHISDIIKLKDGRMAIVHDIYNAGRTFLVEIITNEIKKSEIPIVSIEDIIQENSITT